MAAVGTLEPRKNLRLLVEVLQILKTEGKLNCALLIAGASGWKNAHLYREIQAAGLTEDEIRFLGCVPDDDLQSFYSGAQVFLFPSLYEGFGIPPVEAMACGTPVIASDAHPMPEVLGEAAILEPPTSARRFAMAIAKILEDKSLRFRLQSAGVRRAQEFRYEAAAEQLLQVFGASTP
jgi:glycosyltransferase involved in cell wall biosynthesis